MQRFIERRGSGKTSNLMMTALAKKAIFVCSNPYAMREKAYSYGITGIEFASYDDLAKGDLSLCEVVIDEIEEYLKYTIANNRLIGYTLTNED